MALLLHSSFGMESIVVVLVSLMSIAVGLVAAYGALSMVLVVMKGATIPMIGRVAPSAPPA